MEADRKISKIFFNNSRYVLTDDQVRVLVWIEDLSERYNLTSIYQDDEVKMFEVDDLLERLLVLTRDMPNSNNLNKRMNQLRDKDIIGRLKTLGVSDDHIKGMEIY